MSESSTTTTLSNLDSEQLYDNFIQMSLGELQDYLSLRKLSISGKKRELVARAFAACEQGVPIVISVTELEKSTLANWHSGRLALWQNWRSGKTGALASKQALPLAVKKLALWQDFLKNAHHFGVWY